MIDALTAPYPELVLGCGLQQKGVNQAAFADSRLAAHEDDLAGAAGRLCEPLVELQQFGVSADQYWLAIGKRRRLLQVVVRNPNRALHRSQKAIAAPGNRRNQPGRIGVIFQRRPDLADVHAQDSLAYMDVGPQD